MIEIKDVYFKYKDIEVLKNVNVTIKEGEAVALIGANGSGKSTFLKLVNGIISPTRGQYKFKDEEVTNKRLEDSKYSKLFHKTIGFVFQNSDSQLFCSNVYEEIAFGPRQMGMDEKKIESRVSYCLKLLDVEGLKYREPYNLSGGEKKRVAIACVLAMNPEILVLDEPMNGIDPKGKAFLRELMIKLNLSGKTIICSTHDFEYVKDVFKRALVFSEEHNIIRDDKYSDVINDKGFLLKHNII